MSEKPDSNICKCFGSDDGRIAIVTCGNGSIYAKIKAFFTTQKEVNELIDKIVKAKNEAFPSGAKEHKKAMEVIRMAIPRNREQYKERQNEFNKTWRLGEGFHYATKEAFGNIYEELYELREIVGQALGLDERRDVVSACCGARIIASLADGVLVGSCMECGKQLIKLKRSENGEAEGVV